MFLATLLVHVVYFNGTRESAAILRHSLFSQGVDHELCRSPVAHMSIVNSALTDILERDLLKRSYNICSFSAILGKMCQLWEACFWTTPKPHAATAAFLPWHDLWADVSLYRVKLNKKCNTRAPECAYATKICTGATKMFPRSHRCT